MDQMTAYSLVAAISAIAVYALSFIAFTIDLSRRAAARGAATGERPAAVAVLNPSSAGAASTTAVASRAQGGSGGTTTLAPPRVPADVDVPSATEARPASDPARTPRFARIGLVLATLGFVLALAAVVTRGIAGGGRVPWSNMYEFALTGTTIIVGIFLLVNLWQRIAYLGTFILGFSLLAMVLATTNFYVGPVPLPPALQSAWIVVHVLVAMLGTGFFAVGAGLSIAQLLQARREAGRVAGLRFLQTLPGSAALENLAYRINVIGFVFWTFTLVFGAIWAERAWGRYWGWDTKEVWTFIIWVLFAGYIHARATRGWRGSRAAWLAIIGFSAVIFNFTIVNLFFKGLHAYSGL
jgi:cytochrome c-type biogenesis protein CcsB